MDCPCVIPQLTKEHQMEDKMIQSMPVEKLASRPQVREEFDDESLIGLAQTIRETGVLQPLLVRRDGADFVVIEGHRRLRAAKLAGLTHVPVIIDDRELSENEVLYRQLVTNCQRQGLTPLEKARAIDRLIKSVGLSASQVAVKLGISPGTVSKLQALLELPEPLQQQVANGSLPLTTAYAVSRTPNSETQRQLAEQAASGELRRDDVPKRAKALSPARRNGARRHKGNGNHRIQIPLGSGRSVAVAGPDLTLQAIAQWLQDLLNRIRGLERQDMDLADAVKALAVLNA